MSHTPSLSIDLKLPLEPFTLEFNNTLDARVVGLFGPSGSGKTSLVETIAGLRRNATGKITFGDDVWMDSDRNIFLPPEQRGIGFVPQRGLLFPHLNVRQNLLFGAKRASANTPSISRRRDLLDQVVEILNLGELLARNPATLSGGERQRVAAGRAVCSGPQLLIMDEPLSSLDAALRYKTLAFFIRLVDELKVSLIWVSHDAIEVQAICEELLAIDQGKVTHRGTPVEVLSSPKVFPNLEFTGFQNVFSCHVVKSTDTETIVQPAGGTAQLTLSKPASRQQTEPKGDAIVTIPARSILISTQNPAHVSAGNILRGDIVRIETQSPAIAVVLVQLDGHDNQTPLVVELTTAAQKRLELKQGQSVYVLIKSTACVLQTIGQKSNSR